MQRRVVLAGGLLVTLALAACSGAEKAKEPTAQEVLAQAKSTFDAAKTVAFRMGSSDVPTGQSGVTGANGSGVIDATEPKFDGKVTGTFLGMTGTVDIRAIGDKMWIKLFNSGFQPFDLSTGDAPNPATFFDPAKGLSSLLTETGSPKLAGEARVGKDVVRKVTGTLPPTRIKELFHLGDGTGEFTVDYGIAQNGEVRTITTSGPFYKGGTSTYTITLSDYGKPVDIPAP